MLVELRIRDYAVIERLTVRLQPGLNALTGETGAGKSIIVDALSLLLGERASVEAVRAGATRAVVEGVFDISGQPELRALLDEHGLEEEEGLLILRREVAVEGRNRAWINGAASTASLVGRLGRQLVDLHGQHEHQSLLRTAEQRAILDDYAGAAELAAQVARAHARVREVSAALEQLEERQRELEQQRDTLRFQVNEIEGAAVRPGEEAELEAEATRLAHAQELAQLSGTLHDALYSAEDAVTERLAGLRRVLDQLLRIDESQSEWREVLENAYYGLEDLGRRVGEYASLVQDDPGRLEEVRERQHLLFRLRAKYGPSLEEVTATGERARAELDALDTAGLERATLRRELEAARSDQLRLAGELSRARQKAAKRLDREVTALLPELGMSSASFTTVLTPLAMPGGAGLEEIEFQVVLNVGFEPRPLARVASGGELSRIMLALKTVLARVDRVASLVFDEIDVGIGGRVAHGVAEQLRQVADHHQVFVVTHLPQIAARAQHHLLVTKWEEQGSTQTRLEELDGEARVEELARMLGGDPESEVSLEHARELLAEVAR